MHIRVIHPANQGDIRLKSELDDWKEAMEPAIWDARTKSHWFSLTTDQPFLRFKPVLVRGDSETWADGDDCIALAARKTTTVTPVFPTEAGCLSEPLELEDFRYRVYLPSGYHTHPHQHFPVLYMHDGHNLFLEHESYAGATWRVQETVERLRSQGAIPGAIVVGIYPRRREEDYTAPGYRAYADFLALRLKPLIDQNYRTVPNPNATVMLGSSLGGVATLHAGWAYPEVFGKVACLSPTFGWRDDLFERVAREQPPRLTIYIDSGAPKDNYHRARAMAQLLEDRGFRRGTNLLHLAFPGGAHSETAWASRLHLPLQFFLQNQKSSTRVTTLLPGA